MIRAALTTTAALIAASVGAATEPAPADMPLDQFREKRQELRKDVNRIRDRKCRPRLRFHFNAYHFRPDHRGEVLERWRDRRPRNRARSSRCDPWTPFFERSIRCIYRHERGADRWATNTGNGYYGGLQMDYEFQETHGPDKLRRYGLAHRWPAKVQILVAWRAYSGTGPGDYGPRGFGPWPTTRHYCGV